MAVEARTIDEELNEMVDTYDLFLEESTARKDNFGNIVASGRPLRVWRNNNNKLYLIFRSIAGGFSKLREVVLGSKYRYDPRFCEDDDLESAMFITGETRILAKPSIVRILASNTDGTDTVVLAAGSYVFTAVGGQPFYFTVPNDAPIAPFDFEVMLFTSRDNGSFPVEGIAGAAVSRADGQAISSFIAWEAMENSQSLGRPEEDMNSVRGRLLADTTRQDALRELELALNALPSIYACNVIFNPSATDDLTLDDGTELAPKTLLLVVTGTPNADFASTVMAKTVYQTQMVETDNMVPYYSDLFLGGQQPVYYTFHARTRYYLLLHYAFDPYKMRAEDINAAFTALLNRLKVQTDYVPEINEPMIYRILENHGIAGVSLKKAYIQVMDTGQLETVALVPVPRMTLPQLAGVSFVPESTALAPESNA